MTRATIFTSLLAIAIALPLAACGDDGNTATPDATPPTDGPPVTGDTCPDGAAPADGICRLNNDITTSTTFPAKYVYVIPRLKQLFVRGGATLTIEAGTEIRGEQGSVLVITRGSKIIAAGTAEKPIVLTSAQPVGTRAAGWWGGLLVLGAAPINVNHTGDAAAKDEATFEAFTSAIPEGKFGGTDPHDNSGMLKYVRIEFAGFNFVADREFNNLTLCGVGDATVVDFVQVHGGSDDGVELFGGTVNLKHLVSSQNQDDGFDTDNGWVGKAQFMIVQNISHPAGLPEASNGYESDNHADPAATYTYLPRTEPTVYNVTLIGDRTYADQKSFAAVFRRGTGGHYFNHLWYGFPVGPEIRDTATKDQADAGKLEIRNSMFFNNDQTAANLPPAQAALDIVESDYINAAHNDQFNVDPGLPAAATSKATPDFKPMATSAALNAANAAVPPDDGFFDHAATFVGAVGAVDWTATWTKYPQN